MSVSELVLVRHGQSQYNLERRFGGHSDTELTALGERQAEAVGEALGREHERLPIVAIYTSDLLRAVATAAPLARRVGLPPIPTEDLRERSVGELTGLTFEEIAARYPEHHAAIVRADVHALPPGGESHGMCADRAARFTAALGDRHAEGRVVVFAHGVVIEHILRHVLGISDDIVLRCRFLIDNCAMHRFQRRGGLLRVVKLNDTEHLAGLRAAS